MNTIKSQSVVIKESPDQNDSIYKISIPRILLGESNQTEPDELLTLKVGYSEHQVQPILNSYDSCIEMPQSLMNELGLYSGLRCNANINNGKLNLGPVVAVFTSKNMVRKINDQKIYANINEYTKANEVAQCILYFFCIDDVDLIKQRVNGTIYNPIESRWEKRSFPLPDVLYDRGGSRNDCYHYVSNYVRSQLDNMDELKKINAQSFFDKLYLDEILSEYEDMKPHLPLTCAYSKKGLKELFKESDTVYIKARVGSNGKSIMRVEKVSKNKYRFSTARNEIVTDTAHSFDELVEEIHYFFKKRPLIIQTEIDLLKIDDCIVDMRATLQRDGRGKLGITTYVIRIAQFESPVTSTASGSNVYSFEDFFKNIMHFSNYEIKYAKSEIDELLMKIYRHLEEYYGAFGEMGIDFGMDYDGKLWFIESNSKPAKTTIHLLKNDKVLHQAYLHPLEYAKYLTSFETEPENASEETGILQRSRATLRERILRSFS